MRYDELTARGVREIWDLLGEVRLERVRVAYEHSQWWLTGYDCDDELVIYSVVEAEGPGSMEGIAFEQVG